MEIENAIGLTAEAEGGNGCAAKYSMVGHSFKEDVALLRSIAEQNAIDRSRHISIPELTFGSHDQEQHEAHFQVKLNDGKGPMIELIGVTDRTESKDLPKPWMKCWDINLK